MLETQKLRRHRIRIWATAVLLLAISTLPQSAKGQSVEWSRRTGTIAMDETLGVAVDATGIYAVGYADGILPDLVQVGKQDAYIRKYDAAGNVLWTRQFGSIFDDAATAVAADPSGIYVAGNVGPNLVDFTNGNRLDAFLRKYDANGNLIWNRQFSSIGTPQNDSAQAVVVSGGAVYIAGYTHGPLPGQNPEGGYDAFVRKYDLNGTELWTRQFGTKGIDGIVGISANASGIYVLGESDTALPGQTHAGGLYDIFVRKYDSNGTELWTREFGTSGLEFPGGIAADASGVYVTGATSGALPGQTNASGYDAFVRKYDANGAVVWTRQFGATSDVLSYGVALNGPNVYVTGDVVGLLPGQQGAGEFNEDVFLRKFDAAGTEQWTRQFGTAKRDIASAIAVNSTGVYVGGAVPRVLLSPSPNGDWDGVVTKLVESTSQTPVLSVGGAVNAASLAQAPLVAGSFATFYGLNLAPETEDVVLVQVNGIAAPVFAVASTQVNFQVPWELAGLPEASLTVTVGGSTSIPATVSLASFAPGLFTTNASGSGQGSILIANTNSIAAPEGAFVGSRPVRRGESIAIYATGLGAVENQPPTSIPAELKPLSSTITLPLVTIGGSPATVLFSGLAPAYVGLYQVNVVVPSTAPEGSAIPVELSIGGASSNVVTIAVE